MQNDAKNNNEKKKRAKPSMKKIKCVIAGPIKSIKMPKQVASPTGPPRQPSRNS